MKFCQNSWIWSQYANHYATTFSDRHGGYTVYYTVCMYSITVMTRHNSSMWSQYANHYITIFSDRHGGYTVYYTVCMYIIRVMTCPTDTHGIFEFEFIYIP
jgi:hypothetical protein